MATIKSARFDHTGNVAFATDKEGNLFLSAKDMLDVLDRFAAAEVTDAREARALEIGSALVSAFLTDLIVEVRETVVAEAEVDALRDITDILGPNAPTGE